MKNRNAYKISLIYEAIVLLIPYVGGMIVSILVAIKIGKLRKVKSKKKLYLMPSLLVVHAPASIIVAILGESVNGPWHNADIRAIVSLFIYGLAMLIWELCFYKKMKDKVLGKNQSEFPPSDNPIDLIKGE